MTGNAPLLGELCEDLKGMGHEVKVVAGPIYHSFAVPPGKYRGSLYVRETLAGVPVLRINSPALGSMWHRELCALLLFPAGAVVAGLLAGPCDVIVCPSPPLWLGLSAWIVSMGKRCPFIYNVRDVWPAAPIKLGLVRSRVLRAFLKGLERFVYRRAARVVVIAPFMARHIASCGIPEAKIPFVPDWVDTRQIFPLPRTPNALREELGVGDRTVALYSGNMGHSCGLEDVLAAAGILSQRRPDLVFVLAGEGTQRQRLMRQAEEMKLPNVIFASLQPRERLPEVLAAGDIGLVPLRRGLSSVSLPSKIYTLMASGRPMVAALDSGADAWQLIQDARAGVCVEPGNVEALASAIETLCRNPELARELGRNGRRYAEFHCDRRVCTSAFAQVLESVVKDKARKP
jgi:colanic acid biosynthesis glycosyl transferase WcaI